jgi:hypothetical protein
VDEDPLARIGRTQAAVTPAGNRADGAQRIQRQRALARPRTGPARTAPQIATSRPRQLGLRPAQQDFRSLERPVNTAVPGPSGEQTIAQGLPLVVDVRRRRPPEENPFAPLGLRLGTITVFPTLEGTVGYDDNAGRAAAGTRRQGSLLYRAEAGLAARSDWAVHELQAELRGNYTWYPSLRSANRPEAQGRVGLRLDATRDTAFDFELRGRIDTQVPGSANFNVEATERPLVISTGATAGVTQRFNRLAIAAQARLDRADFADAKLSDGSTLSQKDRNFTQYGLRLRAGYEVTPGLVPFLEAQADTRRYDLGVDNAGFRRNSNGVAIRAGTTLEFSRILTGEVSAGYGLRRFEDNRLDDLKGPILEAGLSWAVTPLTTIRLRGTTEFEETSQANSGGALTRTVRGEISHALLRNLTLTANASYGRSSFTGINRVDDTIRAGLGFDYAIGRNLVARGSYTRERATSNVPGNTISSNIFLFAIRLQY